MPFKPGECESACSIRQQQSGYGRRDARSRARQESPDDPNGRAEGDGASRSCCMTVVGLHREARHDEFRPVRPAADLKINGFIHLAADHAINQCPPWHRHGPCSLRCCTGSQAGIRQDLFDRLRLHHHRPTAEYSKREQDRPCRQTTDDFGEESGKSHSNRVCVGFRTSSSEGRRR